VRLFVGMPVPAAPGLAAVVRELERMVPSAKVVAPGKWHLTLRFLGEMAGPEPVEAALRVALKDAAAVRGTLCGLGGFPDARRARVAWAGVQADGLAGLAVKVRAATQGMGLSETHPFAAHLTLARLPQPRDLGAWCARHADEPWGDFGAESVVLYRSRAGERGAASVYEPVATVQLRSPA
jgi:2'-5' RNA ligase